MTRIKISLAAAAGKVGCSIDDLLIRAQQGEFLLFAALQPFSAEGRDYAGRPIPFAPSRQLGGSSAAYTVLLPSEIEYLRCHDSLIVRIWREEGFEDGVSIPQLSNEPVLFWLAEPQSIGVNSLWVSADMLVNANGEGLATGNGEIQKLHSSMGLCDWTELVRNGGPIDWRYWFGQLKITPEQAAKLTYCIDPVRWPDDDYAQGLIDSDLRIKIAKLKNSLTGHAVSYTISELIAFLGTPFAPYNMEMAASAQNATSPASGKQLQTEAAKTASGVTAHKLSSKRHRLDHIVELAIIDVVKNGCDKDNPYAVWAAMVNIAQGKKPPPPLIDYIEGEGIRYISDTNDGEPGAERRTTFIARFTRRLNRKA